METVGYDSSVIGKKFAVEDKPAKYYMYAITLNDPKLLLMVNVTLIPQPTHDDGESKAYSIMIMVETMTLFTWASDFETFSIPRGEDVRGEIERRVDVALPWAVPYLVQKYYERVERNDK